MDLWTLAELEAIAANPKRKHVLMLIEEVRRLTAIAVTAEQLLTAETYIGRTTEILTEALKQRLAEPRAKVRD